MADAAYGEVGALAGEVAEVRDKQAGRAIVGNEEAEVPGTLLSGEAGSERGIGDSTSEEHLGEAVDTDIGIAKVICVFEEKGTFFGEEHLEALVDGVLRLIGLDLSEVGFDSGIEHKAVMEDKLGIETCLALRINLRETGLGRVAIIHGAVIAE